VDTTQEKDAKSDRAVLPAVEKGPVSGQEQERQEGRLLHFFEAYGLLLLMIGLIVFFSLWGRTADTFFTDENLKIILANQSVPAIIALGALMPLVLYRFDLSIGAVAGLTSVFAADWLSGGMPLFVGLGLAVLLGLTVGVVNAFLIARLGLNDVITTLGTATIAGGIVIQKTEGIALVSDIPVSLTNFGTGDVVGMPNSAIVLAVLAIGAYYLLDHTPFGRRLYAIGSNESAAQLVGINTKRALAIALVAAAGLSALAGALYLARAGAASPEVGPGFTLPAIAAAFLSAAAIKPGRYNVLGTIVAIFFLAVLNSGLTLAGAQPYITDYVNGAALIAGVGLAAILHRRRVG
jgi:ribose transport system permease protein